MSVLSTGGKGQMTPDWAFHIGVWCSAASKGFISSADFNGFEVHKVSVCLDRIGGNVFPLVVFFLSSVFLRFFFGNFFSQPSKCSNWVKHLQNVHEYRLTDLFPNLSPFFVAAPTVVHRTAPSTGETGAPHREERGPQRPAGGDEQPGEAPLQDEKREEGRETDRKGAREGRMNTNINVKTSKPWDHPHHRRHVTQ